MAAATHQPTSALLTHAAAAAGSSGSGYGHGVTHLVQDRAGEQQSLDLDVHQCLRHTASAGGPRHHVQHGCWWDLKTRS
jgi:hypothetical protein